MVTEKIQYGSKVIEFDIEFKDRKTLGIAVLPTRQVHVKAPLDASIEKIKEKIRKRATWILKQQSFFLSFHPLTPPKKYISGETHLYQGRRYRLKIIQADKNDVKLKYGQLQVYTDEIKNSQRIEYLVRNWYDRKARRKLNEYAAPWIDKFATYNVAPKEVVIRRMPNRWGSCSPKGRILLNSELIKAPKGCIEYVIVHELCHLIYPNHTAQFIHLLTTQMPDWEKWKDRLERILA